MRGDGKFTCPHVTKAMRTTTGDHRPIKIRHTNPQDFTNKCRMGR